MGRYYYSKKEEADSLRKIQTWFLKKHGYFSHGYKWGTITWTSNWSENKNSINLSSNIYDDEQFIKLSYTQTDRETGEKKDFDFKVPLVTTPCYFGGKRYWFICSVYKSGMYCGRRVAVLYKGGDYFACRHCYDLSYESRNENRRYRDYALFYVITNRNKIDDLEKRIKRNTYRGKPTRKQRALRRLYEREFSYDVDIYNRKLLTK